MTLTALVRVARITDTDLASRLTLARSSEHPFVVETLMSISRLLETLDAIPELQGDPAVRKYIEAADEAIAHVLGCLS